MAIYHQYQPPHQMHSIIAKFDRLLDMMESRMDAVDRRVENLRRKQYPSPHQSGRSRNIPDGFFSGHPEDAANRCVGYPRAPPLPEPPPHRTPSPSSVQRTRSSYLPHSQPPASRSNYSCYTAGKNAHQPPPDPFTAGDQFMEQELRRIPNPGKFLPESHRQQFLPAKKPTRREPPVLRQYLGFPVDDAPRTRPTMYKDPPKKCVQLRVSVDEPQPPTGWPLRPQPSPLHQPTCWEPPKQQEYSTHEPPIHADPLDHGFVKFQPLPQPPLPHRFRSEVDENRCYGEVVTHTHSPTLDGNEELCDSGDSILEEELCDSGDSILEIAAEKLMDRDRGLHSENRGSREGRDGRLEDQQVSFFVEICPPRNPSMITEKEEKALLNNVEEDDSSNDVKKVIASLNVVQVPSKYDVGNCWSKKGGGAYTGLPAIACVGDVPSMNHRSTSLDTDARLIPPRNDTPYLSILGGDKGRNSVGRYVFDPGGNA